MIRATLTLLLLMTTLARADIAGQEDPSFVSARDLWLAGEDTAALPALSKLAKDGNTAAQILVGRIQPRTHMHSHVTGDMDRKTRMALLRQKGGLSGKNWLIAASENTPLARAFLEANRAETQPQGALSLVDQGEPLASLMATLNLINHGNIDAAKAALNHPDMPADYAAHLRFIISSFPNQLRLPAPPLAQQLLWYWPNNRRLRQDTALQIKISSALDTLKQAAPARTFCAANCPQTPKRCTLATFAVLAMSNRNALHTPSETLIPQRTYENSPRLDQDLRRLAQAAAFLVNFVAPLDTCAAEKLGMKPQ